MKARVKLIGGGFADAQLRITEKDGVVTVVPAIFDWEEIEFIDIGYDSGTAKVGDSGYFVVPRGAGSPDDHIVDFSERSDRQIDAFNFHMNFLGFVHGGGWCMIPTGFTYEFHAILGKNGDEYYAFPRFYVGGKAPYEQIRVEYHLIDSDADYVKICKLYRNHMLTRGGCKPIKDRLTPELDYAKDSVCIRIRMAWKPVPSPVEEQTPENEPEMRVAMTFDEVGEFCEKLKAAGVEKAEICLVGWNVSGHDGRSPQLFPVEPKLGGEEALKRLIEKAHSLGYLIDCHTNCTGAYSIANNFTDYWAIKKRDGSVDFNPTLWSGGRPRRVCPFKGVEYAKTELPKVRALGFSGLHYIDVMSTVGLFECFDPDHPADKRTCRALWNEIAKYCRGSFGGFSSEGCFDHLAPNLDFGLYASFFDTEGKLPDFFTKSVPLWQIVYHGVILSNPFTTTVNYPLKSRRHQLEVIERGGRPTAYIYSKFVSGNGNWMGEDDLTCENDADTDRTVKLIAGMYRGFAEHSHLQTEFIEGHEESGGVSRTTYSDGTAAVCDYNSGTCIFEKSS